MAGKCKCPPAGPNMGYLVSFGDTMTALLAFFIVLNSLAEEQTGANLHSGTGSFVTALNSFGVPGLFPSKQSAQVFQMDYSNPVYVVPAESEDELTMQSTGPDDTEDRQRIIDWEQEDFQRFLNEIERWHELAPEPTVDGEVAFDLFNFLGTGDKIAPDEVFTAVRQLAPLLRNDGYELEVTVWATTPTATAWKRAVDQAGAIRREIVDYLRLGAQESKVSASGRPWGSSTARRPTVSLIARRLQ
ncbi:MAG: flagellar motor protein MotB [Planctomycetaceae bacterium]